MAGGIGSKVVVGKKELYFGTYPGIVEDIEDPDKLVRARVRVFELFSDTIPVEDLPWAIYRLPVGARPNEGGFIPCQVGDYVTIEFLYGDPRRPVITGSLHYCPEGKPNLPHEAWGGEDVVEHKRVGDETTPGEPEYPYHHVLTQHGITVEIYKEKTFCITHRETGSAVSVDKDGNIIIHSEANLWQSAQENERIIIEGESKVEIGKSREETIGDALKVDTGANSEETVGANKEMTISGSTNITTSGSTAIKTSGTTNIQSGGTCTVRAPVIMLN
jgi:uncharacterized protein involved in type VI secretion and phage assembly